MLGCLMEVLEIELGLELVQVAQNLQEQALAFFQLLRLSRGPILLLLLPPPLLLPDILLDLITRPHPHLMELLRIGILSSIILVIRLRLLLLHPHMHMQTMVFRLLPSLSRLQVNIIPSLGLHYHHPRFTHMSLPTGRLLHFIIILGNLHSPPSINRHRDRFLKI